MLELHLRKQRMADDVRRSKGALPLPRRFSCSVCSSMFISKRLVELHRENYGHQRVGTEKLRENAANRRAHPVPGPKPPARRLGRTPDAAAVVQRGDFPPVPPLRRVCLEEQDEQGEADGGSASAQMLDDDCDGVLNDSVPNEVSLATGVEKQSCYRLHPTPHCKLGFCRNPG